VLVDIQQNARLAQEDEETFVNALYQVSRKEQVAEVGRCKKEITVAKARLAEIDDLAVAAVEKNLKGDAKISDNILSVMLAKFEKEKSELQARLPILAATLEFASSQIIDISEDIEALKQHAEVTELTREVVTKLIQVIYMSEPMQNGKKREYNIEIRYKFQPPQTAKENTISSNMVLFGNNMLSTLTPN